MGFKQSWDNNYDFFLLPLILVTFIGNWWMFQKNIGAGITFFTMMLVTISLFTLLNWFIKGNDLEVVGRFIKLPISTSIHLSALFWVLGFVGYFIFKIVISIVFNGFNIGAYLIPLAGTQITGGIAQTFSQASTSQSVPWMIFNYGLNASITEEISFGIGAVVIGIVIYLFGIKLLFSEKTMKKKSVQVVAIIFSILFATFLFVGAHTLNNTYDTYEEFRNAGIFRGVTLVLVYFLNIFLTFFIGFHNAANFDALINNPDPRIGIGFLNFANGMISWAGFIYFVLIISIFIATIIRWEKIKSELREHFSTK